MSGTSGGSGGSEQPVDPIEQMGTRVAAVVALQVIGSLLLVLVLCALCSLAIAALVWPNALRRLLRSTAGRGGVGSSVEVMPGVPALPSVWASERCANTGGLGGRVRSAPGNNMRIVPLEQLLQSAAMPLHLAAFASHVAHNQKSADY